MATVRFRFQSLVLVTLGLGIAIPAQAQLLTNNRFLPPPNGVYVDEGPGPIFGGSDHQLLPGTTWFGFSNCILPPALPTVITTQTRMIGTLRDNGPPIPVDSFFDVFVDLDMRIGPTSGGNPETIPIEILSMNLVGGGLPPLTMIRVNPNLPSLGVTVITGPSGGLYHIDSFFDVFTELSLDGGQTWTPSNNPMHMNLGPVPEPATMALGGAFLAAAVRRRLQARKRA